MTPMHRRRFRGLAARSSPSGSTTTKVLSPYNVDTQDIRTRFWDGHDNFFRDDLTKLKGNHLIQFGGQYQHNYNFHQRTDNGGGINFTPTYQLGDSSGGGLVNLSGLAAGGVPCQHDYRPHPRRGIRHRYRVAGGIHPLRRQPGAQPAADPGPRSRRPSDTTTCTSATPGT